MTVVINGTTGIDTVQDGIITNAKIATMAATKLTGQVPNANAPSGSVIQVVQTVKTNTFSTTSGTFTDITGLSVSITPSSASSKILVLYTIATTADPANAGVYGRLVRDSTAIFVGDAASNRPRATMGNSSLNNFGFVLMSGQYLDSPASASSLSYKFQIYNSGGTTSYVNRSQNDRDNTLYDGRLASSITVMEIAG
jgi:hypothetical protein